MSVVDAETARRAAERQRAAADTEPGWQAATVGNPQLVRTVAGRPSYWMCPIIGGHGLCGFVRVTGGGAVAAYGRLGGPGGGPSVVTWLTAEQALQTARDRSPEDAVLGEPMYVHDGPPGREAWRVDVTVGGALIVLLVGPGGAYVWTPR